MAVIYIENDRYQAREGANLLETCLAIGFDIPYFCWHPALGSVGACRQCAVKKFRDDKDSAGRIVMSCMEPVTDGMRISVDDPEVKRFRAAVIEWLMTSHPHDCPICDEGGECHLQDMTVMTGHDYRRFRFKKRTHRNQYLGPFINHEMNRCIQCYRCVRFYRDYAGGRDFQVMASHHHVYFGRHEEGALESEFSGNLAEVCPTGVFTDKTLKKHYSRKWDLQSAPSVCVHCGIGCNTFVNERYGTIRRIQNRYNSAVNGYFLCDRGRFGYEFAESEKRVRSVQIRDRASGAIEVSDKKTGLSRVNEIIQEGGVIGIGSPRASLESNFALRTLVGEQNFFSGVSSAEQSLASLIIKIMEGGAASFPTLGECAKCDAVLVLGEDVTNTAPLLGLALRQTVKNRALGLLEKKKICAWDSGPLTEIVEEEAGPLFVAAPFPTKIDEIAKRVYRGTPKEIARLGFAVAHAVNPELPPPPGLEDQDKNLAGEIAAALTAASKPLVVSGSGCLYGPVIEAAADVARALSERNPAAGLFMTAPECNSLGLALLGGLPLGEAFGRIEEGTAKNVIILENDLYRRADKARVDRCLDECWHVILFDSIDTPTAARSEIVLPAAIFAEADGTLVNNEGRGQRFFRVMDPIGDVQSSWRWIAEVRAGDRRKAARQWNNHEEIVEALAADVLSLREVKNIALHSGFRVRGQALPRQPHRYSGRTAMKADLDIHEQRPAPDPDSPLTFSMEGAQRQAPSSIAPFYWWPRWNSVQSLNKFQEEIAGPLRGGDPGRRLIVSYPNDFVYFTWAQEKEAHGRDELLFMPYWSIFGTEELSSLSPSIAERMGKGFLYINESDAKELGVREESPVRVSISGVQATMPAKIREGVRKGTALYPFCQPGFAHIDLPDYGKITGTV